MTRAGSELTQLETWTRVVLTLLVAAGCSRDDSAPVDRERSTSPLPETPIDQGFFGSVSVKDDVSGETLPSMGKTVCAGDPEHADRGASLEGTPCATTDAEGNYALELAPGPYRLCFVRDGFATECDPCSFTITKGRAIRRDRRIYLRGGNWGSRADCPHGSDNAGPIAP